MLRNQPSDHPRPRPGQGKHSRRLRRGVVDGRSEYGKFLTDVRAQLTKQLGGGPLTPAQHMLVDRIAWLSLHTNLFDEAVANSRRVMNDIDRRSYLAFSNSLTRAIQQLGINPNNTEAQSLPALGDYITDKYNVLPLSRPRKVRLND
jgi:hypothetical protein